MMKNTIQVLVVIMLLTLTYSPTQAMGQLFFMQNEAIGKKAVEATLKTLDGEDVAFSEYRDGKRAIIFFWATWCPHCRKQLKVLNGEREEIAAKGIKLFIVDEGENASVVKNYANKNKIELEMFLDEDNSFGEAYDLVGVPTFVFVTEEGSIADVQHALPENYEEVLNKKFAKK